MGQERAITRERALEIVGWGVGGLGQAARRLIINTLPSSSFKCYLSPSAFAFAKVVQIYRLHWGGGCIWKALVIVDWGGAEALKLCR